MIVQRIEAPKHIDGSTGTLAVFLLNPSEGKPEEGKTVEFITNPSDQFQVGVIDVPEYGTIQPHYHPAHLRTGSATPEFLAVVSGEVFVDVYDYDKTLVACVTMRAGDFVLLLAGGHGFRCGGGTNGVRIVECKQGPYLGAADKVRFIP